MAKDQNDDLLGGEPPASGHNTGIAAGQLKGIVERVERLEEEKQTLAEDIRDIYAEAKANGFDASVIRQIVRERKKDRAEREEREALLDLYRHALGMLPE